MPLDILSRFYRYLRINTKRVKNPRWLLMVIMSRFRIFWPLNISSPQSSSSYEIQESSFQELDVDNAVKALKEDGIYIGHLEKFKLHSSGQPQE